jgi:hypothetical protein
MSGSLLSFGLVFEGRVRCGKNKAGEGLRGPNRKLPSPHDCSVSLYDLRRWHKTPIVELRRVMTKASPLSIAE